jgi:hypothetical protein
MKIAIYNVVVDRDDMTKPSKQVWSWELPVLESKFPGGLVHVLGRTFCERDSLPDAEEEHFRLQRQYGVEEDTKQAHVDLAYDRGDKGIELLAKAIKGSEWNEKKEAAAAVKAAKAEAAKAEAALKKAEAADKATAKKTTAKPTDPLA